MTSRLLNAWVKESVVSLESTAPLKQIEVGEETLCPARGHLSAKGYDSVLPITLLDTELVMAEDDILIADGLIRWVSVEEISTVPPSVVLSVRLEHPSKPEIVRHQGIPARTDMIFPRESLSEHLAGKQIIVDPGHGGKDTGFRGPVNLLEKDITLEVSRTLATLLKSFGADPILTRSTDTFVPDRRRIGMSLGADLCVVVHTSGDNDPLKRAYHVYSKPACDASHDLARFLLASLNERMGLMLDSADEHRVLSNWLAPTARVEPLCLTYFSDEANFRAPLFRKRTAQALFNGISRYLASRGEGTNLRSSTSRR